jgi:hypothetical protein
LEQPHKKGGDNFMKRCGFVLMLALGLWGAAAAEALSEPPETAERETAAARRQGLPEENARFWSLGAALGSSFASPWLIGTVQRTYALFPYTLVELGLDFGFVHGYEKRSGMEYFSLYPFGHLMGFVPFGDRGGWFGGAGGGAMLAFYTEAGETIPFALPAFDISTGLYLGENGPITRCCPTPCG